MLDVLGDGTPRNPGSGGTNTGAALLDTAFMYDDLLPLPFDTGAMQGGSIDTMGHSMRMPSSAPSPAWAAVPNPLLPGAGMGVPRRMARTQQQEPWAGPYPLASTVLAPGMVPRCERWRCCDHRLNTPVSTHPSSLSLSLYVRVQQAPQASGAAGHQACDGVPSRSCHAG